MNKQSTRRGGFSLIELLVVISIIAVLAAVAGGVYFRMKSGAQRDGTASTVSKLASIMDVRWKMELDSAKNPPPEILAGCQGDKDRAVALYSMIKMRMAFPQTFDEAKLTSYSFPLYGVPPAAPTLFTVQQNLEIFKALANKTYTPAPTAEEQAAALLYLIVTQTGKGGHSTEGLNQQVSMLGNGLTVFIDTYGKPITFQRFGMCNELNDAPYAKIQSVPLSAQSKVSATSAGRPTIFQVKSTLDPTGKLLQWPEPNSGLRYDNKWGDPQQNSAITQLLPMLFPGQTLTSFPNQTMMPVVISSGPNRTFGMLYGGNDDGDDNILSFRLRREGDQGN